MKIHTIIELGNLVEDGIGFIVQRATVRANTWLIEQDGFFVQAVNVQMVIQDTHCAHIITISYREPTTRNLAAAIAGLV